MLHKLFKLLLISTCFIGALLHHSEYLGFGIGLSMLSIGIFYSFYASGEATQRYSWFLAVASFLFLYTVFNSQFISRSALIAANVLASFLFASTLIDSNRSRSPFQEKHYFLDLTGVVKFVLLLIGVLHASIMIGEYIQVPQRVTGLITKDYSQASMAILIIFGLNMPSLRESKVGLYVVSILYLGFFCAFSRSANFLLILFLAIAYIHAFQQGDKLQKSWLHKVVVITLVCYLTITFYPTLWGEATIDRGGLSQLSTLNSRTIYWGAAWEAIQKNPLWGYGLGNYEWSGIKELLPFDYVPNVHNDYIQVWLDLGIFWLLLMLTMQIGFMARHLPFRLKAVTPEIVVNEQKFIAWSLLLCISLYMAINFIISFLFFQLLIALLISEVLDEKD